MKLSFGGRLSLFAVILMVPADRLPAPISQVENETATPAKSATSYETRSADLPRMEVAVGKIKDLRASGEEATKMEVECFSSIPSEVSWFLSRLIQAYFRIASWEASDP